MRRWIVLLCMACPGLHAGVLDARLESLYGPNDVAALVGNGALTAGVTRLGRVAVCRWPSPGYGDQIGYTAIDRELPESGVAADAGLMWGLRVADTTHWLRGSPWESVTERAAPGGNIAAVRSRLASAGADVLQEIFVHPTANLLVARIEVTGLASPPALYWYANFTPCTRLVPEWPLADWAFDSLNDFAVFYDAGNRVVCHFRPSAPEQAEWERARALVREGASATEWASFGSGTYIVYTSQQVISAAHCGVENTPESAYARADTGRLSNSPAASGPCNSVVAIEPDKVHGAYVATVLAGFGPDFDGAVAELAKAQERPYRLLRDDVLSYWQDRWDAARLPQSPALAAPARQCLTTIALCTDAATGGAVRSPVTQPPLSLAWPGLNVWIVEALRAAGLQEDARRLLAFHLGTQRTVESPGRPRGSLPAACYTNGVEGVPHFIIETEGAGWMLWAAWRLGTAMEPEARTEYWNGLWPQIAPAADFVASWTDERTGRPFFSFDPGRMRDAQTTGQLVLAWLALDKALVMVRDLGRTAPEEWVSRAAELDALVKFTCFDGEGRLTGGIPRALLLADLLGPEDARWAPVVDERLQAAAGADLRAAVEAVLDVALLWKDRPERLETLRAPIERLAARVSPGASVELDAPLAAQLYLALMLVFPPNA